MKVKELVKKLLEYDQELEVYDHQGDGEYDPLESISIVRMERVIQSFASRGDFEIDHQQPKKSDSLDAIVFGIEG